MRFGSPLWLFGAALALVVAALFVAGGLGLRRATLRFGEPERVHELVTARPSRRRAWKAVFVVVATALSFFAMARPQYGRGTKLIPATNLDVVVVLDYSKSMYARDVAPSRIARAKAEVARLVHDLAGARFAAVAFAGEPIAFPLTADGGAVAQFFRQLDPNDMPIGGTAIARALESARDLLARDPKSREHKRVIVLVTDGEDLEGDPVEVARAAATESVAIDVVQIGGRTPERIPEVGPDGKVKGFRADETGVPLTTALTAEGETQLGQIAQISGGKIVRAERGSTGIEVIARDLSRMMTEELAERVETVYADVYAYPLGLAILLLVVEAFLGETPRRKPGSGSTPPAKPAKRAGLAASAASTLAALALLALVVAGCNFDPSRPFDRKAPPVEQAIVALDAGDASAATELLEGYLATGACGDGGLGVPDLVRERPNATLDLGVALFGVGERFGRRFGDEEPPPDAAPNPADEELAGRRAAEVECALRVVLAIASDATNPPDQRARAFYLAGNLEFLRRGYEDAVRRYDAALKIVPGMPTDAGETLGQDAAHNRAIALRRIEDEKNKKDAGDDGGNDGGDDAGHDGGQDAGQDSGNDAGRDSGQDSGKDSGDDGSSGHDAGQDSGNDGGEAGAPPPPPKDDQKPEPPPASTASQDERALDQLESAPMFQLQDAKNRAGARRGRAMVDK